MFAAQHGARSPHDPRVVGAYDSPSLRPRRHAAGELRDGRGVSLEVDALVDGDAAEAGVLVTSHELGLDLRLEPVAARRLAAALELAASVVEG